MTQTRFTKGPWRHRYDKYEGDKIIGADNKPVLRLRGEGREVDIPNPYDATLMIAAPLMYEALDSVHKLIAKGALTGFNPHVGHWAEDLFASQRQLADALRTARGEIQEQAANG